MTENYDGYLPTNFTSESKVLDAYRQNLVTPMPSLWKRGGAKVLNWSVDNQASPRSISSSTPKNLIDDTSTTYGSSIPGFTLNMTGKARLSQSSGVPIKVCAYGNFGADVGYVTLRDSAGASVVNVTVSAASRWFSNTGYLPASSGKYYLTYHADTSLGPNTITTGAVSIFEYE